MCHSFLSSIISEISDFLSNKLPNENLSPLAETTREQLVIVLQRDFPYLVKTDGSLGSGSDTSSAQLKNTDATSQLGPDDIPNPIQTGRLTKLSKGSKLYQFTKSEYFYVTS